MRLRRLLVVMLAMLALAGCATTPASINTMDAVLILEKKPT